MECPFDLAKLPAIEAISAETDISGFLAPGVPAELTRAALRRAWSADPRIRDFIGPSENSWDFNAPDAMGGFGPLEITDELRRHILQMVGRGLDTPDTADPTSKTDSQSLQTRPRDPPRDDSTESHVAVPTGQRVDIAHAQQPPIEPTCDTRSPERDEERARPVSKRSHGGALPR